VKRLTDPGASFSAGIIEDLAAERDRLREVLRFYAEIREYNPPGGSPPDAAVPIMGDRGMRARRALGLPEWDGTLPEALAATTATEAERAGTGGGEGE
jgi:hypothetical protein